MAEGGRILLYDGGEARRFTPDAIQRGVAGVGRVMRTLGMLPAAPSGPPETVEVRATRWVRAGKSGICRIDVALGARVARGQRLGTIREVQGGRGVPVRSRVEGIVLGRRINPLVYQGEAVAHIAETGGGAGDPGEED